MTQLRQYLGLLTLLLLGQYACSTRPPKPVSMAEETQAEQAELGPLLGPVTKAKVLDRLKGYPICGTVSEEQKIPLKVIITSLEGGIKRGDQTVKASLVEVECFFFGVQGLYEYAVITPDDGKVYPLNFEGAEPVRSSLDGAERRSPVAFNEGRAELCGVPDFSPSSRVLKVTCKADPEGICGVSATYELTSGEAADQNLFFKQLEKRFHSCSSPPQADSSLWGEID